MNEPRRIAVTGDADIVAARQAGRELAAQLGFKGSDLALIATAISEVARNIVVYAAHGHIDLAVVEERDRRGISVVAQDQGPGIPDIAQAMRDGFSTGGSLGLGLPGARRLMDDFEIESTVGLGTTVRMRRWLRR